MNLGADTEKQTSKSRQQETGTKTTKRRERLAIGDEAIEKIIEDVLGGAGGLAEIFSGEQIAGIFDSSVAAEAAGDLAAKLAGEIARITAEKQIDEEQEIDSLIIGSGEGRTTGFEAGISFD